MHVHHIHSYMHAHHACWLEPKEYIWAKSLAWSRLLTPVKPETENLFDWGWQQVNRAQGKKKYWVVNPRQTNNRPSSAHAPRWRRGANVTCQMFILRNIWEGSIFEIFFEKGFFFFEILTPCCGHKNDGATLYYTDKVFLQSYKIRVKPKYKKWKKRVLTSKWNWISLPFLALFVTVPVF